MFKELGIAIVIILAVGYVDADANEFPTDNEMERNPPESLEEFEEAHGFTRFAVPVIINENDPDPEDLPPAWHHEQHMKETYQ